MEEAPRKRRTWKQWLGLGCAGYLVLMFWGAVLMAVFGDGDKKEAEVTTPQQVEPMAAPAMPLENSQGQAPNAVERMGTPAAVATPEPAPVVAEPEEDRRQTTTVYTTRTGDHYHRSGCSSLRRSRTATTLADAQEAGYEPCHRCRPPQ
ncbi:MAG TPA: Ada metal-binding domain-containing protein [Flavobacteriales bacterium]|nr:Ada metal-binding domain-containing protein [Flavobacteriales bacterium]HMR28539.1 Ada metal-binding domain-containing protein [Flavobacteriales bacterium]